jgi:hypothetical protein
MATTEKRPCFACSHIHAEGPGTCWEAACDPSCRETPECPLPYTPDKPKRPKHEFVLYDFDADVEIDWALARKHAVIVPGLHFRNGEDD